MSKRRWAAVGKDEKMDSTGSRPECVLKRRCYSSGTRSSVPVQQYMDAMKKLKRLDFS